MAMQNTLERLETAAIEKLIDYRSARFDLIDSDARVSALEFSEEHVVQCDRIREMCNTNHRIVQHSLEECGWMCMIFVESSNLEMQKTFHSADSIDETAIRNSDYIESLRMNKIPVAEAALLSIQWDIAKWQYWLACTRLRFFNLCEQSMGDAISEARACFMKEVIRADSISDRSIRNRSHPMSALDCLRDNTEICDRLPFDHVVDEGKHDVRRELGAWVIMVIRWWGRIESSLPTTRERINEGHSLRTDLLKLIGLHPRPLVEAVHGIMRDPFVAWGKALDAKMLVVLAREQRIAADAELVRVREEEATAEAERLQLEEEERVATELARRRDEERERALRQCLEPTETTIPEETIRFNVTDATNCRAVLAHAGLGWSRADAVDLRRVQVVVTLTRPQFTQREVLFAPVDKPEDSECSICNDDTSTDTWVRLACKHTFHSLCIAQWYQTPRFDPRNTKVKCPMCRAELRHCDA